VRLVRLGAATVNQTPLDWDGNRQRLERAIADARAAGVSVLCLPELAITGYGCEDAFFGDHVHRTAMAELEALAPSTRDMVVAIGLPVFVNKSLYNAAALLVDGAIAGFVAKQYLAGDGLHYEPRWFTAWQRGERTTVRVGDRDVPFGDLIFDVGGIRIGFEICEDAWVSSRPGSELGLSSADVILNPSASHFAFDKQTLRSRLAIDGSRAFGVAYVYANLLGNEAGRAIYDGGCMIASEGRMIAAGPRLSFSDTSSVQAVVDVTANRMLAARMSDRDKRQSLVHVVDVDFSPPEAEPEVPVIELADWDRGDHAKENEFTRAVALGLLDYLRKSRSQGFVVSLSGGADSAAVACLVERMVSFGVDELGLDGFRERLSHIARLRSAQPSKRAFVGALLACVYQATRNSSTTTRHAARSVAEGIGAEYLELDVDALVEGYSGLIAGALGRPLTWEQDDIALQNIQARARGPSVWLLANVRGALLLSTSNRSEAAVGYATMDGDTCGGLSPIAGIDKAFLREWLRWMEREIPALAAVNAQAPTAELRPSDAGQTDEDDLMPYPILDAIEDAAIGHKYPPVAVWRRMKAEFPDIAPGTMAMYVERFFSLWCRNQWKRERYAPSFHVDDVNLDPKTWCRFPILSGGYRRELATLRALAAEAES